MNYKILEKIYDNKVNKKLGIIDSGIGGLTLLQELIKQNLGVESFYCSDSLNVPYGNKSQDFMIKQMSLMTENLLKQKVDGILIACNTATAESINQLRLKFKIPFIGIEPYLNHHNLYENKDAKYALILTKATYQSERFQSLRLKLDPKKKIDIYPLEHLALLIEQLKEKRFDELKDEIDNQLNIISGKGYTHLILGCTHYPIIEAYIEKKLAVKTINPDIHVIKQVKEKLGALPSKSPPTNFRYSEDCGQTWLIKSLKDFSFLNTAI